MGKLETDRGALDMRAGGPARRNTLLGFDRSEVTAAGLIMAYDVLIKRVIPKDSYIPANLAAAGAAIHLARRAGVKEDGLGSERARLACGRKLGLAMVPLTATFAGAGIFIPSARRRLLASEFVGMSPSEARHEMLVRIPLGTALGEESLFRAALLGVCLQRRRRCAAVLLSSVVFGLWHLVPERHKPNPAISADPIADIRPAAKEDPALGTFALTTLLGIYFSLLRLCSGSMAAPCIAHVALNSLGVVAARIAARLYGEMPAAAPVRQASGGFSGQRA